MKAVTLLLSLAAALVTRAALAEPSIVVTGPIPLHSGVNAIHALAPDGRDGIIVLAWRENGNAHGFNLALVLLRQAALWNVVRIEGRLGEPSDLGHDTIRDDPHTGDDVVQDFRFARGRVDGRPATLLLVATRDGLGSIPDPSIVTYEVYRLVTEPDVGTTPDHFVAIAKERSPRPFCNAEMALSRRFALKLRPSYEGARSTDGC